MYKKIPSKLLVSQWLFNCEQSIACFSESPNFIPNEISAHLLQQNIRFAILFEWVCLCMLKFFFILSWPLNLSTNDDQKTIHCNEWFYAISMSISKY